MIGFEARLREPNARVRPCDSGGAGTHTGHTGHTAWDTRNSQTNLRLNPLTTNPTHTNAPAPHDRSTTVPADVT